MSRFGRALGTNRNRRFPQGMAIRGYFESPISDTPVATPLYRPLDIRPLPPTRPARGKRPPSSGGSKGGGDKPKGKGDAPPMGTVYVLENGQPKAARISVGITDNRMTEVLDGEIKDGDAVIIEDRQPPAKANAGPGMRLF